MDLSVGAGRKALIPCMNMLSRFTLICSLHGPYACFFRFPFIIFLDAEEGAVYVPTNDCDREVHACSDFLNLKVVGRYWVRRMKVSSVQLSAIFKSVAD